MRKATFFVLFLCAGSAFAEPTGWLEGRAPGALVALYGKEGKRTLLPVVEGRFRAEALTPGCYALECPPSCLPGDNASVDEIFAGGGCVYFERSLRRQVEVVADRGAEVNF